MRKGIISPLAGIIAAVFTLVGSLGVAWAASSSKVAVLEEREQNHYLEVTEKIDDLADDTKENSQSLQRIERALGTLPTTFLQ